MEKTIGNKTYELIDTPIFESSCEKCAFGFMCKTDWTECLVDYDVPKHWREKQKEQNKNK